MHRVPRLFDVCKRVLQANVALITDVGDTPYEWLRDVLSGCRVDQLREIEENSQHIADNDEEIWEKFFIRDFPIAAEARGLTFERPIRDTSQVSRLSSTSSQTLSFRDLYYDEQIAREERLATAGTRLKERVAALKEQKMQRRVILDPKLGLQKRRKRGQPPLKTAFVLRNPVVIRKPVSWAQREYKSNAGIDRARDKALAVAAAYYASPKFTRAVSARYDEAVTGKSMRVAPKKVQSSIEDPYILIEDDDGHEQGSLTNGARGVKRTRTLPQVRKDYTASEPLTRHQAMAPPTPAGPAVETPAWLAAAIPTSTESQRPIKLMPGITRRPKALKSTEQHIVAPTVGTVVTAEVADTANLATSARAAVTSSAARSRVAAMPALPDLPMLSRPPRPSHPSLFIPRKKLKPF